MRWRIHPGANNRASIAKIPCQIFSGGNILITCPTDKTPGCTAAWRIVRPVVDGKHVGSFGAGCRSQVAVNRKGWQTILGPLLIGQSNNLVGTVACSSQNLRQSRAHKIKTNSQKYKNLKVDK